MFKPIVLLVDIEISYSGLQNALWAELEKYWTARYPETKVTADMTILKWQSNLQLDRDMDLNGLGPGFIKNCFLKKQGGKKGPVVIDRHKSSVSINVTVSDEILEAAESQSERTVAESKKVRFQRYLRHVG